MSTKEFKGTPVAVDLEQQLRAQQSECAALRAELEEARAVLEAIRHGEIDALLVAGPEESRVFTLEGAEHPYRVMVESMSDGAATLVADGTLAYANARLAALLGISLERLLGQRFVDFVAPLERERFEIACAAARNDPRVEEFEIHVAEGIPFPARIALSALRRTPHLPEATPGLCLVVTDLTESQRNSELSLAISKRGPQSCIMVASSAGACRA